MHKCEECGREFETERGLHIHLSFAHGIRNASHVTKVCEVCGKTFSCKRARRDQARVCSPECRHESLRTGKTFTCPVCGKEFYRRGRDLDLTQTCSIECLGKLRTGDANPNWRNARVEVKCSWCGESLSRFESQVSRDHGSFCDSVCHAAWMAANLSGANSPSWQGGTTCERNAWSAHEGADWRIAVLIQANHHCQRCGQKHSTLHAHHHWGWTRYPHWRAQEWNGICLCEDCHRHLHSLAGYAERWALAWEAFERHQREALELVPLALPAAA